MSDATPALTDGGWSLWAYPVVDDSPYRHRHVEIWRQEWTTPCCVNPWSLPPQMNVVDLYWRPLAADDTGALRPCDLCRTLTPLGLLRPEAFQEWDALCPACWLLATAQTALELAREGAGRAADSEGNFRA